MVKFFPSIFLVPAFGQRKLSLGGLKSLTRNDQKSTEGRVMDSVAQ